MSNSRLSFRGSRVERSFWEGLLLKTILGVHGTAGSASFVKRIWVKESWVLVPQVGLKIGSPVWERYFDPFPKFWEFQALNLMRRKLCPIKMGNLL